MTDEATGRTLARFASTDSLEENLRTLELYVLRWGRPQKLRTDKSTLFAGSLRGDSERQGGTGQIRRALAELDIRWAGAESPNELGGAAGFCAAARRELPKELAATRWSSAEQADEYLQREFLERWNRRIVIPPGSDRHAGLLPEHDLDAILGTVHHRTVSRHGTIRLNRKLYRLADLDACRQFQGQEVRIETHSSGKILARCNGARMDLEEVAEDIELPRMQPEKARKPRPANRGGRAANKSWMKGFFERPIAPIWRHFK